MKQIFSFATSFVGTSMYAGKLFLTLVVCMSVLFSGCSSESKTDPIYVIFETDIGNDIDDALAIDMLYKYMDQGVIELCAVMTNKCAPDVGEYMDIMNTWYGYPDIPVGIVRNGADDAWGRYAREVVALKNEDGTPMFGRTHGDYDKLPDAHILYRKILASMPDHSVVIPTVGFSTNLARLLDTPADEYSPLTGKELVAKKVKLLVPMAGNMEDQKYVEYNVERDLPAAQKVFAEWPTPIVVSPFELGLAIEYPGKSIENDFSWVPQHPLVESYRSYGEGSIQYDRPTWDLTSVLYAVEGGKWFAVSEPGTITITEEGYSIFTPSVEGNVRYLKATPEQGDAISKRFQEIITLKPANRKDY